MDETTKTAKFGPADIALLAEDRTGASDSEAASEFYKQVRDAAIKAGDILERGDDPAEVAIDPDFQG